ncbi:MAG: histidine kinase [Roseburia sp.]|nr:histidine kinase [Roseburia sp.]MCM1098475.1 histidine kinase [Ruminococcus flavefaciens]
MAEKGRRLGKKRGKWNTLSVRLAYLVTVTFLPVNLLAILVSGVIFFQASGQIRDAYQRELDTAMSRVTLGLERLEEGYSDFLVSYMTELTLASDSDPLAEIEMLGRLKELGETSGMAGAACLIDRKSGRVLARYSAGQYQASWIEALKREIRAEYEDSIRGAETAAGDIAPESGLREVSEGSAPKEAAAGNDSAGNPSKEGGAENSPPENASAESSGVWRIRSLAGRRFLCRQYEYTNYDVGFLLDLEQEIETLGSSGLWSENPVYLESGGTIYTFRDGRFRLVPGRDWESLFERSILGENIFWQADGMDLRVGIRTENQSYQSRVPVLYWVLLLLSLGSVLLAFFLWKALRKRVLNALGALYYGMQELEREHLEYRIEKWDKRESEEFVFLYRSFNRMAAELGLSKEKDARMFQAQLNNLRLQVNPHMLLNSFNMIYSLAQSRNYQCIQEYSLLLVEYFRYSLKETDRFVPLRKEMEFVENYVGIQKIRFPGAFTSAYNIQPDCEEALVPPLLIENFVENAMKYALIPGGTIEVLINIRRQEERLLISVCDTGRGIKPEILERLQKGEIYRDRMGKEHIGVWNCRRRLEVFYGGNASMNLVSSPNQGTQVWLDLPFLEEDGGLRELPGKAEKDSGRTEEKTGKAEEDSGRTEEKTGKAEKDSRRTEEKTGKPEKDSGRTEEKTGKPEEDSGRTEEKTGKAKQESRKTEEKPGEEARN